MKKLLLTILVLINCLCSYAQKELWGTNKDISYIFKFDINGQNPETMYHFVNQQDGYGPFGKLFLASNGKLYGTTKYGGLTNQNWPEGFGVLYEYDLIFNKYRVIRYFTEPERLSSSGLIEPINGKLYGTTGGLAFCLDINSDVVTFVNGYITGHYMTGDLFKASDGNLYGCAGSSSCPYAAYPDPLNGSIFRINTTTNNLETVYTFNCNNSEGVNPTGSMVEAVPGKLYGTTSFDSVGYGSIFEYNISNYSLINKLSFDGIAVGAIPTPFINGNNGKLYSVCSSGGLFPDNALNFENRFGTVIEYNPTTNTVNKLYDFSNSYNATTNTFDGSYPLTIMKTSLGKFMIPEYQLSALQYDPITGLLTRPDNSESVTNLIEICRKPSYKYLDIDTYDTCVDDVFSYDLVNTNANSYVWSHDGVLLPTQTTAVLSFANIVNTDAGIYTCVMTNDCGTTTTMPLKITVGCLGTSKVVPLENNITLYPNPAKDYFNIKINKSYNNLETSKIIITNLLGQIIYEETPKRPNALNFKIDTSKLQQGVYQAQIKTNLGSWSSKFVKE